MYVPGSGGGGAEGEEAGRGGGARRRSGERLAATHFSKTPFAWSSRFFSRSSRASRRFFSSARRAIARIGSLYAAIEPRDEALDLVRVRRDPRLVPRVLELALLLRKRASSVLRSRRWREPAPMRRLDSSSARGAAAVEQRAPRASAARARSAGCGGTPSASRDRAVLRARARFSLRDEQLARAEALGHRTPRACRRFARCTRTRREQRAACAPRARPLGLLARALLGLLPSHSAYLPPARRYARCTTHAASPPCARLEQLAAQRGARRRVVLRLWRTRSGARARRVAPPALASSAIARRRAQAQVEHVPALRLAPRVLHGSPRPRARPCAWRRAAGREPRLAPQQQPRATGAALRAYCARGILREGLLRLEQRHALLHLLLHAPRLVVATCCSSAESAAAAGARAPRAAAAAPPPRARAPPSAPPPLLLLLLLRHRLAREVARAHRGLPATASRTADRRYRPALARVRALLALCARGCAPSGCSCPASRATRAAP